MMVKACKHPRKAKQPQSKGILAPLTQNPTRQKQKGTHKNTKSIIKIQIQDQSPQMTHSLHTPTSPTKHQFLINQSHSPLHRETNRLGLNAPHTQSTLKTNHHTKIQQPVHPINTTPIHPMGRSTTTATDTILNLPILKNVSTHQTLTREKPRLKNHQTPPSTIQMRVPQEQT